MIALLLVALVLSYGAAAWVVNDPIMFGLAIVALCVLFAGRKRD